jgi:hypothetical protein
VEFHGYAFGLSLCDRPAAACAGAGMKIPKSTHNAVYWAGVTKGLDLSEADRVNPLLYNRILWKGMMHNKPYPPSLMKAHSDDDDDDRRGETEKPPANRQD